MATNSGWQTRGTRAVYDNPWISVREDDVVRPDGSEGIYGVVTMQNPSAFVVALTDADEVLMVELFRYATQTSSLEVPAGGTDGEDPLVAAKRELLEETGYEAEHWTPLGEMNALNGVCDAPEFVFLAQGLKPAQEDDETRDQQELEGISDVRAVPWPVMLKLIATGGIKDGETIASLMMAAVKLGRVS